jgi:hypothetical protein
MSVKGCDFNPSYDCISRQVLNVRQEPESKCGQTILNPDVMAGDKLSSQFKMVENCPTSACNGITYTNMDARLLNAAGPTRLQLDRPPLIGTLKLNTLNQNKNLDGYGQNYKSYADINAGQCLYYISHDREDAFYKPLFSTQATIVSALYKDPMGAMKPQYDRIPNKKYDPVLGECGNQNECLSWIRDSQFHREDMLALQMRKRNEQRYAPRWANTN